MPADERDRSVLESGTSILTNESLSSDLERDTPERATELAKRFPGARILIGVRSQFTIMRSIYHLYVKGGGCQRYETFVAQRCGRLFNYDVMLETYAASFGMRNVYVLLQEDLSRDPIAAMMGLLRFIGADPGLAHKVLNYPIKPSVGDPALAILRWRNLIIAPLRCRWPGFHFRITSPGLPGVGIVDRSASAKKLLRLPTERVRPLLQKSYAEANERLFALIGKDISTYDYPKL